MAGNKSLIAFFSRGGDNYVGGSIIDLPVGNTETVAKKISSLIDADIFRIETVTQYPSGYKETTDIALKEQKSNARPELKNHISDIRAYNTIFLGYPNWWGTMPMAVFTFLEENDFTGVRICPFCTHEGSGLGRSEKDIVALCPDSDVADGLEIKGSSADESDNKVKQWLKGLGAI